MAGHRSVTAYAKNQYIAVVAKQNQNTTSTCVISIVVFIGKMILTTTVCRRLYMNGLYGQVSQIYVSLSVQSRVARLKWC